MRISARKHANIAVRVTVAAAAVAGITAAAVSSAGASVPVSSTTKAVAEKAPVVAEAADKKAAPAKPAVAEKADAKKTDAKKTDAKKTEAKKPAAKKAAPAAVSYPDDISGWVAQAQSVLAANGAQVPPAAAIEARAMTESSDNPLAQNHWDENQALYGGTYGLMQMIQPTFNQWALPGHTDIMNPVDSIIASVRYANYTYGSFSNIAYGTNGY
jgi:hypothetical protein